MAPHLDRIVESHRRRASSDGRALDRLVGDAMAAPRPRSFAKALAASGSISLIAEIKRRSPSKGPLAEDLDPAAIAVSYAAGGAAAISVLTDAEFFGGSPADLAAARAASLLPVLRKDFTVDPRDICDARLMGADACLLIVAALDQAELGDFVQIAGQVGLDALVEVHDEEELERALQAGAGMVGVNQRDLRTFEVDPCRARDLARLIPEGVVKVAESGVSERRSVVELEDAGFDAVLAGEALVTAGDPGEAARQLIGATCS